MRRLVPLALLAAAACIDDLEPQWRVTDLRILALRAEVEGSSHADAVPGETLRLEALVANPLGRAPLAVAWFACLPDGTDEVPACLDEQTLRDPAALAALAVQPGSGILALGAGETVSIPIPAASDPLVGEALAAVVQRARAQPTFACGLYAEIPVVAVAEAGGLREVALKRVRVTPDPDALDPALAGAYVRNTNPVLVALRRGATEESCPTAPLLAPAAFPAGRAFLCGAPAAGVREEYNVCDPDGLRAPAPESLSWQWYATAGDFPEVGGVGNATGSTPEFERPPGEFTLWAILRDGRGGEGWLTLEVDALAP